MSERGTIVVDGRSWHRRAYGYWERKIAHDPPETLNLCLYMRAVLIYVPGYFLIMALALTVGTIGLIVTSPLWVPFFMLWLVFDGARRRINALLDCLTNIVVVGIALVVLVGIAGMLVVLALDAWWEPLLLIGGIAGLFAAIAIVSLLIGRRRKKKSGETTTSSGIAKLSWSWLRAKKHRICPLIETRKEPSATRKEVS